MLPVTALCVAWLSWTPPIEGPAPRPIESEGEPPSAEPQTVDAQAPRGEVIVPAPTLEDEPGIEFAIPPPTAEPEVEAGPLSPTSSSAVSYEERHRQIGTAPQNGGTFLAGGLWLLAISTPGTVLLARQAAKDERFAVPYIIATGVALDVMAATMIGVGAARFHALERWGARHRVRPLFQGSGLITSGGLSLAFGALALGFGVNNSQWASVALGAAALASGPFQLGAGFTHRARYKRGAGYIVRPRPGLVIVPSLVPQRRGASLTFSLSF